eukprot:g5878.t1
MKLRCSGKTATATMGFTGIVEEMGDVISMEEVASMSKWDGSVGKGYHLTVESKVVLQDATMGCSIAVNGTCLTVTAFDQATGIFTVGVTPETLRLTNLKALKKGDKVNLERAMSAADRNSGHNVQGHVEGTGQVKGYVAVDGTSLTVCEVNNEEGYFTFMLVQHTQNHVIMPLKAIGDEVNLEPDVLGKYAAQAAGRRYEEMSQRLVALEAQLSLLKRCGIIFAASAVAGALFVGATRQKN